MSFAKKMKRAKARPMAKKLAVVERNRERAAARDVYQWRADAQDADATCAARCRINATYCVYLMNKLFKLSVRQIYETNERVETLSWCLKHSYNANGAVIDVPMVGYEEIEQALRDECKFEFPRYPLDNTTVKQSYCRQKLDGALLALLFTMRVCFSFGRIRLTRMMEQVRELNRTVTYEQYVDMVHDLEKRLKIATTDKSNNVVPPELFGAWIYEEATA